MKESALAKFSGHKYFVGSIKFGLQSMLKQSNYCKCEDRWALDPDLQ